MKFKNTIDSIQRQRRWRNNTKRIKSFIHIFLLTVGSIATIFIALSVGQKVHDYLFYWPELEVKVINYPAVDQREDMNKLYEALQATPMVDAIPEILKASTYYKLPVDLYLGVAFAESSFKNYKCYNPWGIGVGGPRCYDSWDHSVNGFSQLIKYYYLNQGLITAKEIMPKYVGWNNPDWVANCETYYK